ncbi:MAG: aminotransferase class V-fold PLP-dependent enzyme [Planctomycetales bacterium]|nr:aminotransferase class V-fold PLP-dependent enzyme [Planctomycetales bacterium]
MEAHRLILTSGGTEANNLAIFGLLSPQGKLVVGATEHPSVLQSAAKCLATDLPVTFLSVDKNGYYCIDQLVDVLSPLSSLQRSGSLVSLMLANNETGIVQDLKSIVDVCHSLGVRCHSDVVQAVGKIPFDLCASGLDAISVSAHKIHGPVGVGALILGPELTPKPIMFGGAQQLEARPGTESVALCAAMAAALEVCLAALQAGQYDQLALHREMFEKLLVSEANAYIVGQDSLRLPTTSNIAFEPIDRQALLMALDLERLACSTGSACASGSGRPSHVLTAMGLDHAIVQSALRFSFSRFSSLEAILLGAERILTTVKRIRGK